ncbi:HTAI2-like protein [Mya arenaria]|uniref:HTAI2-like protein n=1 Tax=Mya arenaria TaxID=6604 RepID=A0ABY7E1W4_MYAAR|nr:HTAI2-like protein [Mya arenaria]
MAEGSANNREMFRQGKKTAVVLGYTGETGQALVKQLAKENLFSKEQKVVDFENLEEHRDAFSGHDVGFWCLGTTRAKAGVEGFKRVDHDYVLKSAEMAKAGGLKHLHFMSTMGADHRGMALVLMVNRQESRPMEAIARFLLVPVAKVFPTAITIPVESVAQAMINNAVSDKGKSVETFENKDIHSFFKDVN